jgi:tetratricopeptide (TPR) repeat protein
MSGTCGFMGEAAGRAVRALVLASFATSSAIHARPFLPESDDQILERLPLAGDSAARELRKLRQRLQKTPNDRILAAALARRYIALARAESDPRYLGYAEAALLPWRDQPTPPADVLLLRATLRQNRHEFVPALEDLSRVLEAQPRNAQARLTSAVIHQVRGDYAAAGKQCLALMNLADALTSTACISNVAGLTGRAEPAYAALRRALERDKSDGDREERAWALTLLAEIAARTGQNDPAREHFRQALQLAPNDAYLLAAYADFLLDQDQPETVIGLLEDKTRSDGLLLRLTLAEQRLGSAGLATHTNALRARFAASRLRGENLHPGEEARFALRLLKDPDAALRLALSNWSVQREPRDARILLEAALAANKPNAARPVIDWMRENHVEDSRLSILATQLEGS